MKIPLPQELKGKLLYRILGLFLALSIGPLFLVSVGMVTRVQRYIEQETLRTEISAAKQFGYNVQEFMRNVLNVLLVAQTGQSLISLMDSYPEFKEVAFWSETDERKVFLSELKGDEVMPFDMAQVRQVLKNEEVYVGKLGRTVDGEPLLQLAIAVRTNAGEAKGVLTAVVDLSELSDILVGLRVGDEAFAYIASADGRMVSHSNFDLVSKNQPPVSMPSLLEQIKEKTEAGGGIFEGPEGAYLGAYAPIADLGWTVVVQWPESSAYAVSKRMRNQVLAVILAAVALTIVITLSLTRAIVRPIQALQAAMEGIGQGNFKTDLRVQGDDEIAQLSRKFIWMTDALRDKTEQLIKSQKELARWNQELEQRVQERTRELREAQGELMKHERLAAIGQMSSVVGHELRTPLGVINNSAYYLSNRLAELNDEKVNKHLKFIESEIQSANKIINDILAFGRTRELILSQGSINSMLEELVTVATPPENVRINSELDPRVPESTFDREELRQAFRNVMNNAVQAMPDGGQLTVRTRYLPDKRIETSFTDTGVGIPKENLEKIFAPFFTTKSKGTGLGMAVLKKVIDRHSGDVLIQSEVGKGTTFTVILPLQPKPEAQTAAKPAA